MSAPDLKTRYLVLGAGMSGLGFAQFIEDDDVLILEAHEEPGGYCKTVHQDGFTWDYSGHFFHFKYKAIEEWLSGRMGEDEIRTIHRQSRIYYGDRLLDFPFQKNIHQLPQEEFLICLRDLVGTLEEQPESANFKELVTNRFGQGIADRFLIPYNEKLYACPLETLDVNAMGRFFPWADVQGVVKNFVEPDNASYNATFTYPRGGAIQYVNALLKGLRDDQLLLGEAVTGIDLASKTATTSKGRTIHWEHIVSSAPLDRLLQMVDRPAPDGLLTANKVLVFNLGFDRKGWDVPHWIYFPQPEISFYRIGFYDNIFGTDRMSLYVELGYASDEEPDIDATRARVLADLERCGVIDGHKLVSHHHVTLDPAYVHISKASLDFVDETRHTLGLAGVHSIGRYGGWTYCSIEDNLREAMALSDKLRWAEGRGEHELSQAIKKG